MIARTVAAHGGRLIKRQGEGDSTLSVFVRASDAVAAALALQRALHRERWPGAVTLPARAAPHTGEAELRDGDYFGPALNGRPGCGRPVEAARSCCRERRPSWWPTSSPEGAGLADVGSHLLKGLSRPENVFAVVHPELAAPPPVLTERAERPERAAFVGRGSERAELGAALDNALGGQGRLVLVGGEAGIGKTRIAEELCAEARSREARVAWGRCRQGAGAPAYWALASGPARLRRRPPPWGAPRPATELDPEMARFRFRAAMAVHARIAAAPLLERSRSHHAQALRRE